MSELSKRLRRIADRVPDGAAVADIGSDHALLPIYLVGSGKSPSAVAGELNPGPHAAAAQAVGAAGMTGRIAVRRGDGLSVLLPGEADCVTIAGMGGSLMTGILDAGDAGGRLTGVRTLVLQPNVGEELVRRWLLAHDWVLTSEDIVEEDGKIYEIMTAARAGEDEAGLRNGELYDPSFLPLAWPQERLRETLLSMGPWLLREPTDVFFAKWDAEIRKRERICKRMAESVQEDAKRKLRVMDEEIGYIREVLSCLRMDKR